MVYETWGCVKYHPFDEKLDRMKKANEEKIINSYFLTAEHELANHRSTETTRAFVNRNLNLRLWKKLMH